MISRCSGACSSLTAIASSSLSTTTTSPWSRQARPATSAVGSVRSWTSIYDLEMLRGMLVADRDRLVVAVDDHHLAVVAPGEAGDLGGRQRAQLDLDL